MKKWIALSLCMAMLAGIAGCSSTDAVGLQKLTEKVTPAKPADASVSDDEARLLTAAAVRLLQNSAQGENLLLSPLSVLCAVGMTANGAVGNTKAQLEAYFGMDTAQLDRCLCAWLTSQPAHEGLLAANSVWFSDTSLRIRDEFLQAATDYYGADVFQGRFDDAMLTALNGWVSEKTGGMIPELLDAIPEDAVAYLVNALAFRCKWDEPYTTEKVRDGIFTTENGEERTVSMMNSKESVYLESNNATGFMKYYEGGKYAFAALLPNEGISLGDLTADLDGAVLYELLCNATPQSVRVSLPKFEMSYDTELSEVFKKMGVTDAFDDKLADFSGIGETKGVMYISRILHKTCLTVNETGTEAAASTAVEIMTKSARPMRDKSVKLDRPFLYMIVDTETNIPVFIGTVADIGE